jgi:hypothetical protein
LRGKRTGSGGKGKAFVFIHGAWHCSIHWNLVVEQLAAMSHGAIAIDMPGSGI